MRSGLFAVLGFLAATVVAVGSSLFGCGEHCGQALLAPDIAPGTYHGTAYMPAEGSAPLVDDVVVVTANPDGGGVQLVETYSQDGHQVTFTYWW